MRIFFFITKSEQGGAQTHVAQLTRWLVEHGHEVAVMSPSGGWLELQTHQVGGRFLPNEHLGNTANLHRLRNASRCFLEAVDAFKPDVVACHSTIAGLIGRLSLRARIPTIFTAHGWGFTQGAPLMRRILLPIFERLAGMYAKKIICVSRNDLELAHKLHRTSDEKLALVYNGVETHEGAEIASAVERPRNDTGVRKINILFVGRLAPPKNPFLLVEAFSRLPHELQERAHITIIGDGSDRTRLEALIESLHLTTRIELTGTLPREQVLERLRSQADIFVLLSRWEGFPYSILEAMAAGVPVIASRVGGIPEALEHGGGILVDDLAQLTDALSRLIRDVHIRTSMGLQARHSVESHFSVESMCEKTFAQYEEALLQ